MKQNPTIYKIEDHRELATVILLITEHLGYNKKKYIIRDLTIADYNAKLLVIQSSEKESEWASFFPQIFLTGIKMEYKMPSLLFLISTHSGTYAIIGGSFYKYLLPFIDTSYGLNTYSRIMRPVHDQIITIKTRGVTGLRAGMSEQFKDNYRLMDYIKFGKIPTELKVKLSSEVTELYFSDFLTSRSPNVILNISCGFNINKNLSFQELGSLIQIIEHIETLPADDFFSSYKEITNTTQISTSLKPAIINKLFQERENIINNKITNFDICYPNKIEEFYSADSYEIKLKLGRRKFIPIGVTQDKNEILRIILQYLKANEMDNELDSFSDKIYNIYIYSYTNKSKGNKLQTALIYHLNTEIYLQGIGTFIYLDSKWYKLRSIFINEMNSRCQEIINSNNLNNSILHKEWKKGENNKRERESNYNGKYNINEYLVTDEITPDSFELADIIKINSDSVYLCHVKYGFSTEMRDLYSQITSSARRLKNDLKNEDTKYLRAIYKGLKNKERNQGYSESQFIKIFRTKTIKYVMAITGHLKNKTLQKNIDKYQSNIAKLSLIQCYTEMRTEYYDLSFEIIKNDACF